MTDSERPALRVSFGRIAIVLAMAAAGFWLGNIGYRYATITFSSLSLVDAPSTPDLLTFISQSIASYPPLGLSPDKWPTVCGIAGALGILIASQIMKAERDQSDIDMSEVHGSQELADVRDRKIFEHDKATEEWPCPEWCERVEDDNLILTKNTKVAASKNPDYTIERECPNRHIFIMGTSGRGKSYSLVGPNIMQLNGSLVISDPKGELFRLYAAFLEAHGYKVELLGLRDEDTIRASSRYNPLSYCENITDINQVVNYFMENTTGDKPTTDPKFFADMERSFYTASIGLRVFWFKRFGNPQDCTMPALLDDLLLLKEEGEDGVSALDRMFEGDPDDPSVPSLKALIVALYGDGRSEDEVLADEKIPEVSILNEYRSFKTAAKDPETMGNVAASCAARLSIFNNPALREMLSEDELELDRMGREKRALFLGIKAETGPYDFVAAMAVNQVFALNISAAEKSRSGHVDIPIWCWLDELANIGKIPNLEKLIAVTRSYWINIVSVVQNGVQLRERYGEKAKNVMSESAIFIFLGSQDWDDCEMVSKKMGTTTRMARSVTRNTSRNSSSVSETYQPYSVPLMSPAELYNYDRRRQKGFDPAKCLTHYAGSNWCMDYKYDLHDHPRYRELKGKEVTDPVAWSKKHRESKVESPTENSSTDQAEIMLRLAEEADGNVIVASL